MKKNRGVTRCLALALLAFAAISATKADDNTTADGRNVIDEVLWIVGDEAILKSDVETARLQALQEGTKWKGDPDCVIPEQLAVQKLFLHQAAIDSVEVTETEVMAAVDERISDWIQQTGSREKLEEYRKMSVTEMRNELHDVLKNMMLMQRMKSKLVENVKVTPSEVRRYYNSVPKDSLPFVPTEVEVEIITQTPKIEQEEINRVKDELRDFTDRITKGETSFATLARLYSEDPGTARRGGELDYTGRGTLDPAFAAVAFNLTDPTKVSKIVESEFGYHIIQLIDKRGDKIKVRHILIKPKVSQAAINSSLARLDSIRNDIVAGTFSFEEGASVISDDKETRNNHGLMANALDIGEYTSKFRMQDLPSEVARVVDTMAVGTVSAPFEMINTRGKTVCAIVKVKSRTDGHKANITDDYQTLMELVLNKQRETVLKDWVTDKIKTTYTRINDRYKNCDFEYAGWIK